MVKEFRLDNKYSCKKENPIGRFPTEDDYDEVIREDCDVFVDNEKVISFRKKCVPVLRNGCVDEPEAWKFFRCASREVHGTQRGLVAGSEYTSRPDTRLTAGQAAFFHQSSLGLVNTIEEAKGILESSDELTTKTIKIKWVKRAFPEIKDLCAPLESQLRKKTLGKEEEAGVRRQRRIALWSWFEPWLKETWGPSKDKVKVTKEAIRDFISTQQNFNHCYSNVLGAVDRGSRFPYGRLSLSTQRHIENFTAHQEIYCSIDNSFEKLFPEKWKEVSSVISNVKEPFYNLFGTVFTSITLNFNFKTALHLDKNNLKGGLAALTVFSQGDYEGHYLVFPQVRLAFDVRNGDLIIADTQVYLHGNTEMTKLSEDAERISLVFYSREGMTKLEDLECEACRKSFVKHSLGNLPEKGKGHKDWTGVWPEMWHSREWVQFKEDRGLQRCSNTNWRMSEPYRNLDTGEVKLFEKAPSSRWVVEGR
jgi:hypothetical protein